MAQQQQRETKLGLDKPRKERVLQPACEAAPRFDLYYDGAACALGYKGPPGEVATLLLPPETSGASVAVSDGATGESLLFHVSAAHPTRRKYADLAGASVSVRAPDGRTVVGRAGDQGGYGSLSVWSVEDGRPFAIEVLRPAEVQVHGETSAALAARAAARRSLTLRLRVPPSGAVRVAYRTSALHWRADALLGIRPFVMPWRQTAAAAAAAGKRAGAADTGGSKPASETKAGAVLPGEGKAGESKAGAVAAGEGKGVASEDAEAGDGGEGGSVGRDTRTPPGAPAWLGLLREGGMPQPYEAALELRAHLSAPSAIAELATAWAPFAHAPVLLRASYLPQLAASHVRTGGRLHRSQTGGQSDRCPDEGIDAPEDAGSVDSSDSDGECDNTAKEPGHRQCTVHSWEAAAPPGLFADFLGKGASAAAAAASFGQGGQGRSLRQVAVVARHMLAPRVLRALLRVSIKDRKCGAKTPTLAAEFELPPGTRCPPLCPVRVLEAPAGAPLAPQGVQLCEAAFAADGRTLAVDFGRLPELALGFSVAVRDRAPRRRYRLASHNGGTSVQLRFVSGDDDDDDSDPDDDDGVNANARENGGAVERLRLLLRVVSTVGASFTLRVQYEVETNLLAPRGGDNAAVAARIHWVPEPALNAPRLRHTCVAWQVDVANTPELQQFVFVCTEAPRATTN